MQTPVTFQYSEADGIATITLDRPLEYMHFGQITFGVDERGEVGLLTRNIRIRASDDAEQSYFGGHIMAMPSSIPSLINSSSSTGDTTPSSISIGSAPCFFRAW